ncbi:MAG: site-specific DNA-methyltransferase [Brevundimonas sp.]
MTDELHEKLPLTSMDVAAEKRDELRHILADRFPEAVSEGKIDLDQLKRVLGEWVEPDRERFGLNWPGKAACMKVIQAPSVGTLKPCPEESVDWDATQNLFIEGDNLEVLKLLQKAYFGRVKMIYIDPPYNTGKEFIYPDKYAETLETYLEYTGQVDGFGRRFSTNTDSSGRFHSRWLSMMYPRIYLAKNLLSEDGYICVSIGEEEVHNLRSLLNDIFGEENFINCVSVMSKVAAGASGGGEDKKLKKNIEYILIYTKNISLFGNLAHLSARKPLIDVIKEMKDAGESWKYTSIIKGWGERQLLGETVDGDGNPIYIWKRFGVARTTVKAAMKDENLSEQDVYRKYFAEIFSDTNAQTSIRQRVIAKSGPLEDGEMLEVRYTPRSGRDKGKEVAHYYIGNTVRRVIWLSDVADSEDGEIWKRDRVGNLWQEFDYNNVGKEGGVPFPNGKKPIKLIQRCIEMSNSKEGICLDFFAGSGSAAHAVIQHNIDKGANWQSISIQLPEPIDEDDDDNDSLIAVCESEGISKNIAAVARLRIKRAGRALAGGLLASGVDVGFRVFELSHSAFKRWDGALTTNDGDLLTRISEHAAHLERTESRENLLYELLLKDGFQLTTPVSTKTISGKLVFSVANDALLLCLESALTQELLDAMAELEPSRVICLDASFQGNDQLKANAVQTFKARARSRETAIEFRTV